MKYQRNILIALTGLFVLGGIWSLNHGLPFHLVGDEEAIIGGTLQFLNQKTLLPVLNQSAFEILYYPIALPYSILTIIIPYGLGVLAFSPLVTSFAELGEFMLVNLDQIWWLARLVSLIAGALAVYVTYKIAETVFPNNKYVGFFAALFVLTSFFHFQLSVVMRHWMFSTVLFMAAFYFLFKSQFANRRDTLWAGIFAALASGFGQIGLITSFFVGLSYLVLARKQPWLGLKNKNIWLFSAMAIAGFAFFVVTHPGAFASIAAGNETEAITAKTPGFFIEGVRQGIVFLLHSDAVVTILGLIGALIMFIRKKAHIALLFIGIVILHNIFLVAFIHNAARYQWYILPLLAIMGAYALSVFWSYMKQTHLKRTMGATLIAVVYLVPLILLLQYGNLMIQPTTEQKAFEWLDQKVDDEVILIHSRSISPLQQDEFVSIQDEYGRSISRNRSLAGVDAEVYGGHKCAYTNTHFWDSKNQTPDKIQEFINNYNPAYILISYSDRGEFNEIEKWYGGFENYNIVYQTAWPDDKIASNAFSDFGYFNHKLFTTNQLGQHIIIYKQ